MPLQSHRLERRTTHAIFLSCDIEKKDNNQENEIEEKGLKRAKLPSNEET